MFARPNAAGQRGMLCAFHLSLFSLFTVAGCSHAQTPKGDPAKPALIWLGAKRLPGFAPDTLFKPLVVSNDGSTVYGQYENTKKRNEPTRYFKWAQDGSIKEITKAELPAGLVPVRPGSKSLETKPYHDFVAANKFPALQDAHHLGGFRGISSDSKTILGDTGSDESVQYPYLWRATTGMVRLKEYASPKMGITEKFNGLAYGISNDGKTVVGIPDTPDGVPSDVWLLYDPNGFSRRGGGKAAESSTRSTQMFMVGVVKSLHKGEMILLVDLVVLPNGQKVALKPARTKRVLLPANITVPARMKVADRVTVVGNDGGTGKPLTAQLIVMPRNHK